MPPVRGFITMLERKLNQELPSKILLNNEFQRLLCKVAGYANFKALQEGITNFLEYFVTKNTSTLPNSIKELKCFNEFLIFLLRLVTLNPVPNKFNHI